MLKCKTRLLPPSSIQKVLSGWKAMKAWFVKVLASANCVLNSNVLVVTLGPFVAMPPARAIRPERGARRIIIDLDLLAAAAVRDQEQRIIRRYAHSCRTRQAGDGLVQGRRSIRKGVAQNRRRGAIGNDPDIPVGRRGQPPGICHRNGAEQGSLHLVKNAHDVEIGMADKKIVPDFCTARPLAALA